MSMKKPTGEGIDKIEVCPNNQAKCRACKTTIRKGEHRVGVEAYMEQRDCYFWKYYHKRCISVSSLRLGGRSAEDELANQHKKDVEKNALLRDRYQLRETLRRLRMTFAKRLGVAPFIVFHDTTLNDLVVKMPSSNSELLAITGIGPKKARSFGREILHIIDHFRVLWNLGGISSSSATNTTPTKATPPRRSSSAARAAAPAIVSPNAALNPTLGGAENEGDGEVEIGETISCEELVNRKFEHAKKNGYLIEV